MIPEIELKVRELDNPDVRILTSAKRIAEELGMKLGTAHKYLIAKRQGHLNYSEYNKHNIKEMGFESYPSYHSHLSRQKGFIDISDYLRFLYHRKNGRVKSKDEYFDGLWRKKELTNNEDIENIQSVNDISLLGIIEAEDKRDQTEEKVSEVLAELNEKQRKTIIGRFYEGKTLEQIGTELDLTRTRVCQIEEKALKKLYLLAKKHGLADLYFH